MINPRISTVWSTTKQIEPFFLYSTCTRSTYQSWGCTPYRWSPRLRGIIQLSHIGSINLLQERAKAAILLFWMWQVLHQQWKPYCTHEDTHWREAILLFWMWQVLHPKCRPYCTHEDTHWREAILLFSVPPHILYHTPCTHAHTYHTYHIHINRYVIEPYNKYPELLGILFNFLKTEQSMGIRREVYMYVHRSQRLWITLFELWA